MEHNPKAKNNKKVVGWPKLWYETSPFAFLGMLTFRFLSQ